MPLYRPSDLHKLGIRVKKHLSQNFLIDQNILEKICKTADIKPGDQVLEIGPGPGAITEKLLEKGAHVTAIEKDEFLAEKLAEVENENLKVFQGDALTFPLNQLPSNLKLVANLPFRITAPILERWITTYPQVQSLTVVVQKEVGLRMTAKVNTPDYSSFSLFLSAYGSPKYAFTIKPSSFFPAPSVHACVIEMPLHPFPYSFSQEEFFKMTRAAFGKRRKMLRSSLKELVSEEAFKKAGIDPTARPGELSLEDFAGLYRASQDEKSC